MTKTREKFNQQIEQEYNELIDLYRVLPKQKIIEMADEIAFVTHVKNFLVNNKVFNTAEMRELEGLAVIDAFYYQYIDKYYVSDYHLEDIFEEIVRKDFRRQSSDDDYEFSGGEM